jgi:hypothetical protein
MNIEHRIKAICGTSVDDAKINMQNENELFCLDLCLQYEKQHSKRSTMIKNLNARIRKLETGNRQPATGAKRT